MRSKQYSIISFFFLSYLFLNQSLFAQNFSPISSAEIRPSNTIIYSNYNTLESCTNISAKDYPVQMARFQLDRPGFIQKITLHLDGRAKGKFTTHIYGHESGLNFPFFAKDLTPPIQKKKRKRGYQAIEIELPNPVFVNNDQFYIVLDNFTGDFGLKQDATFYQDFCNSENGGNYYPTILETPFRKLHGENCALTMDVTMQLVPAVPPIFEEVTKNVGIPLNLYNEHIAWGDLDGDNWLDLIVADRIYKNKEGHFEDITQKIFGQLSFGVTGAAFVDIDNNGRQDILLFGYRKSALYIQTASGVFEEKAIDLPPLPSLHGFSIADINNDEYPDLVLVQLWDAYPVPQPNYLFLNDQKNNFKEVTKRLYPSHNGQENQPLGFDCIPNADSTYYANFNKNKRSRGCQFTDIDLDGDVDLYITNYFLETDELYLNDGQGFFTSLLAPKAVDQSSTVSNHGTGVDWYDYDNDGDFDLLMPQLAHPGYMKKYDHRGTTIFRNDRNKFTDLRDSHGIEYEETHAGATFGDVNNDGLADIITTVYYDCRYIDLYLQQPNHRFELSTYQSGLAKISTGNDACFVDFNNDGLLDLAMGIDDKFRLFKNKKPTTNAWIKLQLQNVVGNHFGIGGIVKVYANNQVYTQEVNAGRGQKMQKPTILHFGLGAATKIDKIEVKWQKNQVETFFNCQINKAYTLVRGGQEVVHKK
ncbi:MAG: CRTAC1 family protein [Saprospiraceae bacterium]